MIYLDNNATTLMPNEVKLAMLEWCNRGNPSAGYASAQRAREMMNELRQTIGAICGVDTCCGEADSYKVIFTSGATESNCTIISGTISAVNAARAAAGMSAQVTAPPHVVASAVEHKSVIEMLDSYVARGLAQVTFVAPDVGGFVPVGAVEDALQPNTVLVCVMHANNETGAVNNVRDIGSAAHRRSIPFHCDTAQTFGKIAVSPLRDNIDSFCISFHKIHGPPGVGALVVRSALLAGYKMPPLLFGTQNEGLRGGTENVPGLGAALAAVRYSIRGRPDKNVRMYALKLRLMGALHAAFPTETYAGYLQRSSKYNLRATGRRIVFLSGFDHYLPGTLLLAVVGGGKVCNGDLKTSLERQGIVVSVGSACNTASPRASHVLYALGADEYIRAGTLRISLGDETTEDDIDTFAQAFIALLTKK